MLGNVYIADGANNRIREVSAATGGIITVAGNGTQGFSGDGGPAISAELSWPDAVILDATGNLYIADQYNNRIRKAGTEFAGTATTLTSAPNPSSYGQAVVFTATVTSTACAPSSGTIAFSGVANTPVTVAVDATGTSVFSISTLSATAHTITARYSGGTGCAPSSGSAIQEVNPASLTVTANSYSMTYGGAIPKLTCQVSGAVNGDSFVCAATTAATSSSPVGTYPITVTVSGVALPNYIVTSINGTLSIVYPLPVMTALSPSDAVAGSGGFTLNVYGANFAGASTVLWNNSSRTTTCVSSTQLQAAITAADIATAGNAIVTVNTPAPGGGVSFGGMFSVQLSRIITTVAGNGTQGYKGDGGSATSAELYGPAGVAVDASGNLYIADASNNRVREVNAATGVITTVAGTGVAGYSGDGGPATSAELNDPSGIAVDAAGDLYIADTGNNRIREVSAKTGTITTVAGSGTKGYGGDNGLAISAELNGPYGVAINTAGNLYIADSGNNVIREVGAATGVITTVAGNGTGGFSGDGSPATSAELHDPLGVAVDTAGNLYIADTNNQHIRKVDATTALITTVAGNVWGGTGFGHSGGNGPATAAGTGLWSPEGVAVDAFGNLYVADMNDQSIRQVNVTGIITMVAGNGTAGYSGDNGPAIMAELNKPKGMTLDAFGNLYIADTGNRRIRKVAAPSVATGSATTTVLTASANPTAPASPVTFTATVTGSSTPAGSVAFYAGPIPLGTVELNSSGIAGYTTSILPLGTYGITAFYGGDANHQPSASAPLSSLW
jgi:sugar lactone lactonase YvrE